MNTSASNRMDPTPTDHNVAVNPAAALAHLKHLILDGAGLDDATHESEVDDTRARPSVWEVETPSLDSPPPAHRATAGIVFGPGCNPGCIGSSDGCDGCRRPQRPQRPKPPTKPKPSASKAFSNSAAGKTRAMKYAVITHRGMNLKPQPRAKHKHKATVPIAQLVGFHEPGCYKDNAKNRKLGPSEPESVDTVESTPAADDAIADHWRSATLPPPMPDELLLKIFRLAAPRALYMTIPCVCVRWRQLCREQLSKVVLDFDWAMTIGMKQAPPRIGMRCNSTRPERVNPVTGPGLLAIVTRFSSVARLTLGNMAADSSPELLARVLKACPGLTHLDLDLTFWDSVPLEYVHRLELLPTVQHGGFWDSDGHQSCSGGDQILEMVSSFNRNITHLAVGHASIHEQVTDRGLAMIAQKCVNLTELVVEATYGEKGEEVRGEWLEAVAHYHPYLGHDCLTKLDLTGCDDVTSRGLTHLLTRCPKLTKLGVVDQQSTYDDGLLETIIGHCPQIVELELLYCTEFTDQGYRKLAEAFPLMIKLDISGTDITDTGLGFIASGCPKMRELTLAGCPEITDRGLGRLASGCPNITKLVLPHDDDYGRGPAFTSGGLELFARGCSRITTLAMGPSAYFAADTLESIAKGCHAIVELDFSCEYDHQAAMVTDSWLCDVATRFPNITSLNLGRCTSVTTGGLAQLLAACHAIADLNLCRCPQLKHRLAGVVATNCPLISTLNLCDTRVTDKGLAKIAKRCRKLTAIALGRVLYRRGCTTAAGWELFSPTVAIYFDVDTLH